MFNQLIQNKTGQEKWQMNPINSTFAGRQASLFSFLLGFQNQIFLSRAISLLHSVLCHPQKWQNKMWEFCIKNIHWERRPSNFEGWLKKQNKKLCQSPAQALVLGWFSTTQTINISCRTLPSRPSRIQTDFLSGLTCVPLALPNEPLNSKSQESKIREFIWQIKPSFSKYSFPLDQEDNFPTPLISSLGMWLVSVLREMLTDLTAIEVLNVCLFFQCLLTPSSHKKNMPQAAAPRGWKTHATDLNPPVAWSQV